VVQAGSVEGMATQVAMAGGSAGIPVAADREVASVDALSCGNRNTSPFPHHIPAPGWGLERAEEQKIRLFGSRHPMYHLRREWHIP
jgi:hypothetical protein